MTTAADGARGRLRSAVSSVAVLSAALVAFIGTSPGALLTDAFPYGADHAGFPTLIWSIAHQILPAGSPVGWSDAMLAGIPVNTLYPPAPATAMALLGLVIPLAVAYKLVMVAGVVAVPVCAFVAARCAALPWPLPAVMAVLTLPLLYDPGCVTCGGNIQSVMRGMFSYQWGLALALLAVGLVDRALRERRGTVIAVLVTVAASWSHPVTALWLAVALLLVVVLRRPWRDSAAVPRVLLAGAATVLLAAAWWVPFLAYRDWMPALGAARIDAYVAFLFPASPLWEVLTIAGSLAGAVIAWRRGHVLLQVVSVVTVLAAVAFVALPDGQLYNARVLPFWTLGRWLLLAPAVVLAAQMLGGWLARARPRAAPYAVAAAPVVVLAVFLVAVAPTQGWIGQQVPASDVADGQGSVLGRSVVVSPQALPYQLAGYEARPDAPQLGAVVDLLRRVGAQRGCGRLAWDQAPVDAVGPEASPFGDDKVFFRSAVWTDGCVDALTGVLIDSSSTSADILMSSSLASRAPYRLMSLPFPDRNLALGLERLRLLGVRYYLTTPGSSTGDVQAAVRSGAVSLVADAGGYRVYELARWGIVEGLSYQPVVLPSSVSQEEWRSESLAYSALSTWGVVPLAAAGPGDWPRRGPDGQLPGVPVTPATVSDVESSRDVVRFRVDRVGTPVVVRVSDFPGWEVTGADGPYRVTPNLLAVVPTGTTVELRRATPDVVRIGLGLGAAGLALTVVLGALCWRDRRVRRSVRSAGPSTTERSSTSPAARPRR